MTLPIHKIQKSVTVHCTGELTAARDKVSIQLIDFIRIQLWQFVQVNFTWCTEKLAPLLWSLSQATTLPSY
jgi:hypothetical protein